MNIPTNDMTPAPTGPMTGPSAMAPRGQDVQAANEAMAMQQAQDCGCNACGNSVAGCTCDM